MINRYESLRLPRILNRTSVYDSPSEGVAATTSSDGSCCLATSAAIRRTSVNVSNTVNLRPLIIAEAGFKVVEQLHIFFGQADRPRLELLQEIPWRTRAVAEGKVCLHPVYRRVIG